MNKFIEFLKDEDGQTSTEYILLVAVAAMLVFKFRKVAETRLDELTGKVFDKADSLLD